MHVCIYKVQCVSSLNILVVSLPVSVCENYIHLLVFSWFHATIVVFGMSLMGGFKRPFFLSAVLLSSLDLGCNVLQIVLVHNEEDT
jgi:hypothetical protein